MRSVAEPSQLRTLVAAALMVCLVASCDGGTNGDSFMRPSAALAEQSPAGIYTGIFQSTATAQSQARSAAGVVSEDSEVHLMLQAITADSQLAGFVSVDGEALNGTLTEYLGARARWFGFDGVRSIVLDGTVSQGDSLSGDYGGDDAGVFRLDYSTLYERTSSLAQAVGVWTFDLASSGGGVYVVTLDIDPSGQLFGADTNGCLFVGDIGIVDSRFNVYNVSAGVSSCDPVDGEYSGLAFRDELAGGNALYFFIANESYAFSAILSQ